MAETPNAPLTIILAQPRGFCAGVDRAIAIVEKALELYGAPVYVRHEIVHNRYVVENLRQQGAIFVKEVDEVPNGGITIFSAHGVSQKVEESARLRDLPVIDATCPLVTKVHNEAKHYEKDAYQLVLIGHKGHPEVEGTSGRVQQEVPVVATVEDVAALTFPPQTALAYVTQTTLSVDETRDVVQALRNRYPHIKGPGVDDICYATQNRQDAVRALTPQIDLLLVIGSQNSSNSNRLRDIGEECHIPSYLIDGADAIDARWLQSVQTVGITAGASAPEVLVEAVIARLEQIAGRVQVQTQQGVQETMQFRLPREVRSAVFLPSHQTTKEAS